MKVYLSPETFRAVVEPESSLFAGSRPIEMGAEVKVTEFQENTSNLDDFNISFE